MVGLKSTIISFSALALALSRESIYHSSTQRKSPRQLNENDCKPKMQRGKCFRCIPIESAKKTLEFNTTRNEFINYVDLDILCCDLANNFMCNMWLIHSV